jgi:LacI family transcriptional regulator
MPSRKPITHNVLPADEPPHVALLVETSLASGRDILTGIARYVREHQPWLLFHEPRSLEEDLPGWLKTWKGQGIIARVQTPKMANALRKTRIPVVDVLGVVPTAGFPLVHVDDEAIGAMGAEHLLVRGFKHFAFLGIHGENWSEARSRAFIQHLERQGYQANVRKETRHQADDVSWEVHQSDLATWVRSLPKPVGIMVCSDQRGGQMLDACRRASALVPDQVAVIGVDNDQPLCSVCNPPLSSVWPNHSLVGYEAARILERLMSGDSNAPARTLTPPKKVVTRHSTDTLAIEDEMVASALRVIRDRACKGIRIDDISAMIGCSRSVLQRRFRSALGRSMHQELVTQRLNAARHLLIETSLPLMDIAERCGFRHQEYMGAVFKATIGQTPAQVRKQSEVAKG